jgi:hypothetical protein
MTAAQGLRKLEQRALAMKASRTTVAIALVAAALVVAYCSGRTSGIRSAQKTAADSARRVLAESSAVIEKRIAARTVVIHQVDTIAVRARQAHAAAAAHVAIIDDSTVRVDSGPPVHEIPATIAIPEIRTCAAAITADTIDARAVVAQLADVTKDRDAWKQRALTDEANAPKAPRFGIKTGVAIGAALVVAVLHLVR